MAKPDPSASGFDAAPMRAIIAGIGCRRGVAAAEIIALIESACAAAGQTSSMLVAIASLDRKGDERGLLEAATCLGVPLRTFSAAELEEAGASGSSRVEALVGTSSVAEAAALRAGALLAPKLKSAHATCALAMAGADFDLAGFGQAVGGSAPASTASMAASRSLTSNAGP
jgi:cobalamin biosynthesis protein CbiG